MFGFLLCNSCCQEAWQSRRICETLKTPEELKEKKASIQVLADAGTVVKTCQNIIHFLDLLEKLQTQERWKAHYKTLRDEKKRKAEEDGMQHCKMLQVKMSRALSSMLRERGLSDETCCDNL